ncbi:AAA family ATPase [bacterium]|nr:AAA family ATPase [bacterium]
MTSFLPELFASMYKDLNAGQEAAMKLLHGENNVFVTGGAGTGKSYLMKQYLKGTDRDLIPVLASTGAAAVLIGGRTIHSFFGLGILEGGPHATLDRALKDRRVVRRLKKANAIVIDEVSMIPGIVLAVAERIACEARKSDKPWGGIKIIAVGDFAQLPPVNRFSNQKDWAFMGSVWKRSQFQYVELKEVMRAQEDQHYCEVLSDIRRGELSDRVKQMLEDRSADSAYEFPHATVLYARKMDVDRINMAKLSELPGREESFESEYVGPEQYLKTLKKNSPVPEVLKLKEGAFVMIRQNDPRGRWVNGSLGYVRGCSKEEISIELVSGRDVEISKTSFSYLDADGKEVASAKNFPLSLAWAVTIHKAQGATLDRAVVSIRGLWEPGQAYVALSRVRSASTILIDGWDEKSIFADPQVKAFHEYLDSQIGL